MSYSVFLQHASASDDIGGKALALARLAQAGLPVPPAFAISATALDDALRANGLAARHETARRTAGADAAGLRAAIAAMPIPAAIRDEITDAYRSLSRVSGTSVGDWLAVAVRSSGVGEDETDTSFAGIFESYLNISGPTNILAAIRDCWASAWSETAVAYRSRMPRAPEGRMAVLVQLLVPASASGVLFTIDPVANDSSRLVVNAAPGLSADVLSGHVACDTLVLSRADGSVLSASIADKPDALVPAPGEGTVRVSIDPELRHGSTLSPGQQQALREAALRAETVLGRFLDVEWAFLGDDLYLLQARPVTTVGAVASKDMATWTVPDDGLGWLCADELFPQPVCEWGQLLFEKFASGLNKARESWHSLCELHVTTINGWVYMADRLATAGAGHQQRYEEAISRVVREAPIRWQAEWRDAVLRKNLAILNTDVSELPDGELLTRMHAWLADMDADERIGGIIGMVPTFALARMASLGGEIAEPLAEAVLHGLPSMLEDIEDALWVLAGQLAANPRARAALLTDPGSRAMDAVIAESAAWEPIAMFLRRYGFHGMESVTDKPWREDPQPLIAVLRQKIHSGTQRPADRMAASAARRAAAVAALASEHPGRAQLIRDLAADAEACLPLGQDRFVVFTELGHAVARHYVLEVGRRLAAQGLLDDPADALHLRPEELDRSCREKIDSRNLVAERRRTLDRQAVLRPPRSIGAAANLAGAPYVIDSILSERIAPGSGSRQDSGLQDTAHIVGSGIPSSAGVHVGRAAVCPALTDAKTLRRGDVLVCETTSPAWTQYFAIIGAVVTERGGMLSHPAVIAREYGIPAVTGMTDACRRIQTGQLINVDGDRGVVGVAEVLREAAFVPRRVSERQKMRVLVLGHSNPYADYARDKGISLVNVLDSHGIRLKNLDLQREPVVVADRTSIGEILAALYRRGLHLDIGAVFTNSEAAMLTAAALAPALGARGLPIPVAVAVRDKAYQKERIRRQGIPVAPCEVFRSGTTDVARVAGQAHFPAVIKPLSAAGGVAVNRVRDAGHLEQVLAAYADLYKGMGETWLLESYIDGTEMHMDGLVLDGRIEFLSVGRYLDPLLEQRNGCIPGSVILNPAAHDNEFEQYREFAEQCLAAIGLRRSVFHMELFDTARGLVFSECAARCGGQFIVPAIGIQYGLDLELAAFQLAVANEFTPPVTPKPDTCAGWIQLPVPQGRITRLPEPARVRALPGVVDVLMDVSLGDEMPDARTDLSYRAGIALVTAETEAAVEARMTALAALYITESEAIPIPRRAVERAERRGLT